tara:strand:+ start:452 stop:913 length:462 start_codon:yes stop_codon:yes gene_type:complete
LIIKRKDISSILPIIIKIIIDNFEVVSKSAKLIGAIEYSSELTVLVRVRIDNLNAVSNSKLSINNNPDKINKLTKKEMNTKNESFVISLFNLFSENKIYWLVMLFGFTNLKISIKVDFKSIYILSNFIPDVLEIIDPPIIVKNKRYREKFSTF